VLVYLPHFPKYAMPRNKWTSEEQEDWLKNRYHAFREAEVNETRKSFYKETYAAWLAKWPNPEPSAKQVADATSHEGATKAIHVYQEKVSGFATYNLLVNSYMLNSVFKLGFATASDLPWEVVKL
jgi:hypothetical protein